ncbi:putative RNA-directed DNA polymerase [Tanacetum coccineum]
MKGYVEQLERLGYVLPEDIIVGLILNGLTKDFVEFVRNYNMHNMGMTIGEIHAMFIEYEKGLPKKAETPQVMMIKGGRIKKANKKSLKAKGKGKDNVKGKDNKVYIPKPKNPKPISMERPTKDDAYHHCKEVGHWKRNCLVYLAELLKKKKQVGSASFSGIFIIELFSLPNNNSCVYDTGCGTHICNTKQGFRIERKLKQGALYLYVGNGVREQVEAIGSYDLVLPNGLVICLDNCHYAPTITRGVVSVSRLVDNGFVQCFADYEISISKNNVLYFNAIARNGIYEIDMYNLVPNINSIYNVSNKRVKRNLDSTYLWHCHLAHINKKRIKQLQQDGLLKSTDDESFNTCESCLSGKMTKNPFPYSNERVKDLLDMCQDNVLATSLHSQMIIVVMVMFIFLNINMSQEFKDYLKANGIVQPLTPPYTPQHNGVSEWRNRTLLDMVRSMMNLTTLPLSFWDYALESATRILNMVPTKKGCETLVKRDTPDKLEQRSVKCIFIGYPKETMGYYFYFPPENKIVVARYAEFFEKRLISQEISRRAVDLEEIQEEDTTPSEITSNIPQEVEGFEPPQPPQEEVIPIRRSGRTHRAPNRLCLNEPTSYKAAMLDSESNKWINAMNAEIQSMMDNMVWVPVDLPLGCKTVGTKGYTQLYGVDYEETFSPVADIRAIRILISIAAYYDYEIWQMDVKTAFLNGYLDEDIYMVQPEGFVDPNHPRKVCKLQRSIYGLKQASRSWNKRFDEEIKRFGFTQNLDEPCVYQKASGRNVTFLILYVDDIIIMGNHIPSLQSVKDYLGKCFAMKDLGEAAFILGIKIYRDRSKRLIGLCAQTPNEVNRMKNVPYASAVGSIMYAVRCTRPDVAFAQNMTSRFQQNPGEPHWTAVKNILKYLRNTKDMFLVYGGNPSTELRAQWIGRATRKYTAVSATESEYIAGVRSCHWKLLGLGNLSQYLAPDTIHRRYHFVREGVDLGEIRILKVQTDNNLADPFTNALSNRKLTQNMPRGMGLVSC